MCIDQFENRWAIVTGAASGIGAAFAKDLTSRGMHAILIDCEWVPLVHLAAQLQRRRGSQIIPIACDLSDPEELQSLVREVERRHIDVELLVNNAGIGVVGGPERIDVARVRTMLRVNIEALTQLTYHLIGAMSSRRHGAIINIASMAAFQPVAYLAAYAASKAYILHFSEALWVETQEQGVTVTAVCPGFTDTSFFTRAGAPDLAKGRRLQAPNVVVDCALKAMKHRRQLAVPGLWNYLLSLGPRVASRRRVVVETAKQFRMVTLPSQLECDVRKAAVH